jgi:hypothetical protein
MSWRKKSILPLLLLSCGISFAQDNSTIQTAYDKNVQEIVVVFKSHFDIGYTHLASEVVQGYRTTAIDNALTTVDKYKTLPGNRKFVWTIPGWPMTKILEDWDGQTETRKQRVMQAFKEGMFTAHALPFTVETEMLPLEQLVRGMTFSAALMKSVGKEYPTSAKMTDVPEHSWLLPTLLKNAGVNFLHLGCNPGSAYLRVPLMFWWQGPDGSKLLTFYSSAYGSTILPPDNWNHKTWLAMIMRGDNAGPPSPEEVQGFLDQIHAKLPNVKVTIGTLSDFSERIMKEDLSGLPVIHSDMTDTWAHGVMVDPPNVSLSKQTPCNLFVADYLHTLLSKKSEDTAFQNKINKSYEQSLLFYEHTWGASMYWVAPHYMPPVNGIGRCDSTWCYGEQWKQNLQKGLYNRMMASWDEHSNYEITANSISTSLSKKELTQLANAVRGNVVFNPLPWKRDNVPALGYVKQDNTKHSTSSSFKTDSVIENSFIKITVNRSTGAIQSLVDKRNGKELAAQNAPCKMSQLLYERFSENEVRDYGKNYIRTDKYWAYIDLGKPNIPPASVAPYSKSVAENFTLERTNAESLQLSYQPASDSKFPFPYTTKISLLPGNPYFDLEITLDKNIADPLPEALWVGLPININKPTFRVGRFGSIIDPVKDLQVKGINRYMYNVGTGVAVIDDNGAGVGICPLDATLVSIGETAGWKYDTTYVPSKPNIYFNLFNNQWSTNYRLWNQGKWVYRFRVWPIEHYDNEASLITPSLEALYPLQEGIKDNDQSGSMKSNGNAYAKTQSGLSLSRKAILVTAFGNDPFGNKGTLLRLWEQAGKSGDVVVTLPPQLKYTKAMPVNLRSQPLGSAIQIVNNKFSCKVDSFAPVSFLLME